jgi:putative transposase
MVEGQSMTTVADVVAQVRDGRLEDFVREAVVLVARELMEGEITSEIGAELGEVAPDARSTHRNGYRPRAWETRVGEIELLVPRKRSGSAYFPSFLEARRPAEQAIVAVVMEAYVNGVSTRKVDRLVEQLGIAGMTKDRVSAICRGLDERVAAFRDRPLEGAYPYLWLDAKVRHEALLDRAGWKTPPLGCRSSPGEAEGSLTPELRGSGGSSPDNDGTRGNVGSRGLGKRGG